MEVLGRYCASVGRRQQPQQRQRQRQRQRHGIVTTTVGFLLLVAVYVCVLVDAASAASAAVVDPKDDFSGYMEDVQKQEQDRHRQHQMIRDHEVRPILLL
jgi:hypothetical protein